jgi:predicted PurR-regulated permease PerM
MEGALATALFAVFRLPSPFLWGIIVMVLSMIPLIGTNLVLFPAGILTIVSGRPFAGLAILVAGTVGVFFTQNVVKPKLLGDRSGLNPALALLATVGGIAWLGIIGFLIGPVLASLFIVVWRQFALRYKTLLAGKDLFSDEGPGGDPDGGHGERSEPAEATPSRRVDHTDSSADHA